MSNNHHKNLVTYLMENSDRSVHDILGDGLEFEKFVKQQACLYGVAHLKDVLRNVKKEFGLVKTICTHLQTDEIEAERDDVMNELRSFIYTDRIHCDDYILDKDYHCVDNDIIRLIRKRARHINTVGLQKILNDKQVDMDAEVKHGQQKRSDIIRKLANYLCAEEVREAFPVLRDLREVASDISAVDLIIYLNGELTKERRESIPDPFDLERDDILAMMTEHLTSDELADFEAYVCQVNEGLKKAQEIEGDKDDRIQDQVIENHKLTTDGGYQELEELFAEIGEGDKLKLEAANRKKQLAIDKMADIYRFKYVLSEMTTGQLPRNVKDNLTAPIKNVFGNLKAHELTSLETLQIARERLILKYPHASMISEGILNDVKRGFLYGKREIKIRPILIVGDPGNGKSSLARDVMKALDVYAATVNAGGMFENHILGLSSGYSSAMPSIITTAVANSMAINPAIIIDEIDKTSRNKRNGDLADGLLSLLEPSEAVSWYEKFLNMNVDASQINWILTANDIGRVPLPLVSRCTVYRMQNPGAEHVGPLVQSVVTDYAREVGVDPRFFRLSANEMDYLRETMPRHQSVRVLRQLVRLLLDEHESSKYHA